MPDVDAAREPTTTDLVALKGEAARLRDEGALEQAEGVAARAVMVEPGDREALFLLGDIRCRAGRYAQALAVYERLVAARPEGENGWFNRGLCFENLGRYSEAASDFARYLSVVPDDVDALARHVRCAWEAGNVEAALASAERATTLDPRRGFPYFYRSLAAIADGRFLEARADCDTAERLGFESSSIPYNRALCCHKLGDAVAAKAGFDRYVELRPDDPDGWERRGLVKIDLGDRAGARLDLTRAIELDPTRRQRLAERLGEPTPGEATGRDVLRAFGQLFVALLAFGSVLALLLYVVLPFAGEHDTAGTVLMILSTVALLVIGVWAVARKWAFALLFFPWLFEALLAMRSGRRLVGLLTLAGGLWMATGLFGTWWEHGVELTSRRIKEAIIAVGFVLMVLGFGAALLFTDAEGPATGADGRAASA